MKCGGCPFALWGRPSPTKVGFGTDSRPFKYREKTDKYLIVNKRTTFFSRGIRKSMSLNYKQSLVGFHNPYLHKDLTPTQFLKAYIKSQKRMFKKKDGWNRKRLVEWIEENWDNQLKLVARLFPNTLRVT